MIKSVVAFLAFLFVSASAASAQSGNVVQWGTITQGHCMTWAGSQRASDAGGPCQANLQNITTTQISQYHLNNQAFTTAGYAAAGDGGGAMFVPSPSSPSQRVTISDQNFGMAGTQTGSPLLYCSDCSFTGFDVGAKLTSKTNPSPFAAGTTLASQAIETAGPPNAFPARGTGYKTASFEGYLSEQSATLGAGGSGGTSGPINFTVNGGTCDIQPQFSGTVTGGVLTAVGATYVDGVCSVWPGAGATISGTGVPAGATVNVTPPMMTVTTVYWGNIANGQLIWGKVETPIFINRAYSLSVTQTGATTYTNDPDTHIVALGTGTGGVGTYILNASQTPVGGVGTPDEFHSGDTITIDDGGTCEIHAKIVVEFVDKNGGVTNSWIANRAECPSTPTNLAASPQLSTSGSGTGVSMSVQYRPSKVYGIMSQAAVQTYTPTVSTTALNRLQGGANIQIGYSAQNWPGYVTDADGHAYQLAYQHLNPRMFGALANGSDDQPGLQAFADALYITQWPAQSALDGVFNTRSAVQFTIPPHGSKWGVRGSAAEAFEIDCNKNYWTTSPCVSIGLPGGIRPTGDPDHAAFVNAMENFRVTSTAYSGATLEIGDPLKTDAQNNSNYQNVYATNSSNDPFAVGNLVSGLYSAAQPDISFSGGSNNNTPNLTDGAVTLGSNQVTSPSCSLTQQMFGQEFINVGSGTVGAVPAGTILMDVATNGCSATMSNNATSTASGLNFNVGAGRADILFRGVYGADIKGETGGGAGIMWEVQSWGFGGQCFGDRFSSLISQGNMPYSVRFDDQSVKYATIDKPWFNSSIGVDAVNGQGNTLKNSWNQIPLGGIFGQATLGRSVNISSIGIYDINGDYALSNGNFEITGNGTSMTLPGPGWVGFDGDINNGGVFVGNGNNNDYVFKNSNYNSVFSVVHGSTNVNFQGGLNVGSSTTPGFVKIESGESPTNYALSLFANNLTSNYSLHLPAVAPPDNSGNWCLASGVPMTWTRCGATANGSVQTGLVNDLAWYQATGNTIGPLVTANDAMLVTSDSGVPSISTALTMTQSGALGLNASLPAFTVNDTITGNGNVTVSPNHSNSFWTGLYVNQTKSGDGSGQAFTFNGQLGAVGPTGYNEGGGFEGIYTNNGSTNGLIEGVGFQIADSANGGTNHYKTSLTGVLDIIDKYDTTYPSSDETHSANFTAASNGSAAVGAVLYASALGPHQWYAGVDLSQAIISSGAAFAMPNNTGIESENAAGSALVSDMFLDASNNIRIGFGGNTSIFGGNVQISGANPSLEISDTVAPKNWFFLDTGGNLEFYDGADRLNLSSSGLTSNVPVSIDGNLTISGYNKPYTGIFSGLPSPAVTGAKANVTDATGCTFLGTVTGGGSTFCPVVYNGTAWVGG